MNTESEEDLLFYIKVAQKRQNPTESHFEIIFAFNSSGTIIENQTETNPLANTVSNSADSDENISSKSTKTKGNTCSSTTELFGNTQEITTTNPKRSLFRSDNTVQTDTKPQKKAHKGSQISDAAISLRSKTKME
jgi:hypothetical protein